MISRMDKIKVTEKGEILIVDDYGMNVMFDCSLEDMVGLDQDIMKTATYYVRKAEEEVTKKIPVVDRIQVLEDLYECEYNY